MATRFPKAEELLNENSNVELKEMMIISRELDTKESRGLCVIIFKILIEHLGIDF